MNSKSRKIFLTLVLILFVVSSSIGQGALVAAGGGSEGDIGQTNSWSYRLYKKLVENGDTNNDGIISVSILTASDPDTSFMNSYFRWIGQSLAVNVKAFTYYIDTKEKANLSSITNKIDSSDVVFIKGGDQGVYYDLWNGTLLETAIRNVVSRNGAIGGTSAGAMSLAEFAFAGGKDLVSADVLTNSMTRYLDDDSESPGHSGIHNDFLSLVKNAVIDTHFGERGRLGRTIGILAKVIDDSKNDSLFAIGIDRKTGLFIKNGIAEVIGEEAVSFIKPSEKSKLKRNANRPLLYTDLVLDHLTEGWKFDLKKIQPVLENVPDGTTEILPDDDDIIVIPLTDSISVNGSVESDKLKFEQSISYYPAAYKLSVNNGNILLGMGFTLSGNSNNRGDKQEGLFRGLYDRKYDVGVLLFSGGWLSQPSTANKSPIWYFHNPSGTETASIVIDSRSATHKTLGKYDSYYTGNAKNISLLGLKVHVLSESLKPDRNYFFNRMTGNLEGGIFTSIPKTENEKTNSFEVSQPYPNPFNPEFTIEIAAKYLGKLNIEIYDLTGRMIESRKVELSQNRNKISFNLEKHPSGLYVIRLSTKFQSEYKKIILLK